MNLKVLSGFYYFVMLWTIISIPVQNIKAQNFLTGDLIRVMSYNIRYAGDPEKEGADSWPERKEKIALQIVYNKADIAGLQEPLLSQLNDLSDLLPGWKWIGNGRDDGDKKGEFSAILYKADKFEVKSWDTFWLSPSPETPSKGWDAALNRTATWALMKIKETGRLIFFINTHFDHIGTEARKNSAELLVSNIKELAKGYPVILTGDFNDTTYSEPYDILTAYLSDSRKVSMTAPQGPGFSFNGFNTDIDSGNLIDYIFVQGNMDVKEYKIIAEKFNGRYPSDHFPVLAVIEFKNFK